MRPIRVENGLGVVPLTNGLEALVDVSDIALVGDYLWHAKRARPGSPFYAARSVDGGVTFFMHHAILGKEVGRIVDHINRNSLDNRRANLRWATVSQNRKNARDSVISVSGIRGVYKAGCRWWSKIQVGRRPIYLGTFDSQHLATEAYRAAERRYFGEFVSDGLDERVSGD